MKEFIKKQLREHLNLLDELSTPTLSLPKNINISNDEKREILKLNWSDLIIDQLNDSSPVHIKVSFPWDSNASEGIAVDIQIINNVLYQLHISLSDDLKGLGLGYKIYKALIMTYGHLYSGNGRRQNNLEVPKIWSKLKSDKDISCNFNNIGNLCVANINPDKDKLLKIFNN